MVSQITSTAMPAAGTVHKVPEKTHQYFESKARELADIVLVMLPQPEQKTWSSYLPSFSWITWESTGKEAGTAFGATYGQTVMNQGIDYVAMRAFEESLGRWGAQGAAEGFKVVAAQWVAPYLPALFGIATSAFLGVAGPLVGAGASCALAYIMRNTDPQTLALMSEDEMKAFLEQHKAAITESLVRFACVVFEQEIYAKLYECKTNQDVKNVLETYVMHRQADNAIVLKDGYVLNKEETKQYNKLIKRFSDTNMNHGGMQNKAALKELIPLIAIHTAKAASPKAKGRVVEDQIECKDGIFCKLNGSIIDQEEARNVKEMDVWIKNNQQLKELADQAARSAEVRRSERADTWTMIPRTQSV